MKSEELRLNNYVMCRGALSKIISINENTIGYKKTNGIGEQNIPLKFVQPIPLTEEWLLKFGFEKHPEKITNVFFKLAGRCLIEYDLTNNIVDLVKRVSFDLFIEIEYVHQLQNLVFSLTGEEL